MKKAIWWGMSIGGTVGGYIPALWGDSWISFWSLLLGALGAMAGIYIAFKLTR
jgi:ABC-type phosphate transport system permease subunit